MGPIRQERVLLAQSEKITEIESAVCRSFSDNHRLPSKGFPEDGQSFHTLAQDSTPEVAFEQKKCKQSKPVKLD